MLDSTERVSDRLPAIGFDSAHSRVITWEHLLTQTSQWKGECFGMPDQVEHYRRVSYDPKPAAGKKGDLRPLNEPGTYWEYNDVRINQRSLSTAARTQPASRGSSRRYGKLAECAAPGSNPYQFRRAGQYFEVTAAIDLRTSGATKYRQFLVRVLEQVEELPVHRLSLLLSPRRIERLRCPQ